MNTEYKVTGRWWETFVPLRRCWCCKEYEKVTKTLIEDVVPAMRKLEAADVLKRWCFLIHNRADGVPTKSNKVFVHIRFDMKDGVSHRDALALLPRRFYMTRRIPEGKLDEIAGLDLAKMDRGADGAWDLICDQSQLMIRILKSYRKQPKPQQVAQWLHYFSNMMQMQVR